MQIWNKLAGLNSLAVNRLLLSEKQFVRTVAKERMRCDRHDQIFGLITLNLTCDDSALGSVLPTVAKVLHKRLRLTDEKGFLPNGLIGVLLPMTDLRGMRHVLQIISEALAEQDIFFRASLFVYPHDESQDRPQGPDAGQRELVSVGALGRSENSNNDDEPSITLSSKKIVVESAEFAVNTKAFSKIAFEHETQVRSVPLRFMCEPYPAWKRTIDIMGALFGLTITAPIMLVAAVAIKLTSPGEIFFKQSRTGFHGNEFTIYKLRSMVQHADQRKHQLVERNERDGPAFKMTDDPRVTFVGKLFRATGVDELPQLWNVLRGDMAIVGPRPLPCDEAALCKNWQRRRLDAKPGITCIWQIKKSSNRTISFADWMRMDLKYLGTRSVKTDIGLICKTIFAVARGKVGR